MEAGIYDLHLTQVISFLVIVSYLELYVQQLTDDTVFYNLLLFEFCFHCYREVLLCCVRDR